MKRCWKTQKSAPGPAFGDASTEAKFAPFVLANRIPIEPGNYKLEIEIINRQAQQTFKGEADVAVGPRSRHRTAGPLVTTSVDRVARPDPFQPFQYFGVQFHPSVRHEVNHPDPLRLLFELHEPAGATADYQMEYIVAQLQDKDARRSIVEDVKHSRPRPGDARVAWLGNTNVGSRLGKRVLGDDVRRVFWVSAG